MLVEYWQAPRDLTSQPSRLPSVYAFLRGAAPAVVLELPVPRPDRLPGNDATYEYWSTSHWNPLVNGYSGYYPAAYLQTLEYLKRFPDDESMGRLRAVGVRYIVVHRTLYESRAYANLLIAMIRRPDLEPAGTFRDWAGEAAVFVVRASVPR
jgi:hypothetical protein